MRLVCERRCDEHRARGNAPIRRTTPGSRKIHLDLATVDNVRWFYDVGQHECRGGIPAAEFVPPPRR